MPNFYAVKQGKNTGIFDNWEDCEIQIKGFSGAVYKKFKDYDSALKFLNQDRADLPRNTCEEDVLYAYVDGSYNDSKKIAGYGVVMVKNDAVLFKDLGAFRISDMIESRNVFGEIRGALKAVELALANDFTSVVIAYDYKGIECWATGEWKANKILTKDYRDFMQKYMKRIEIKFKKIKAHSGEDKYNDLADSLAKKAVEIL
ncbi:viroplasmin family protein [Clostridium sp. MT-14]|jgi:ribonuclease HI|uniref:ribonuclease H n=1 Tax=Clostridium aromativorans TaxID=2836848 RepID=A0ABS8N7N9_9CLOT|nr:MULTISPECIES: ribonuclease H family protein [Clostridium]KAA8677541.1 reverse transcriptase-like protein [Clostridium sp. HV4-5-A1G]MCC9295785.1 ribonuclease H family protein [Clostridium aromativorans]CAB1246546.1 Ribonuclease HI-related protein [Clostridiaceae bacterium BL-3]